MIKLEALEWIAKALAAPTRRDAFVFGMPLLLGPRLMMEDQGRVLHWWSFPLCGYDGGMTNQARRRFEALYYGEPAINPFFEACDVSDCPICTHPAPRSHRVYTASFSAAAVDGVGTWYEGLRFQ